MPRIFRFDRFEVDLSLGQLRCGNVRVHVHEQSLQALAALLERPGEVVSRDDLRHRLWGGDVFVDFENGLNTVIGRLREALGDSAESPRFIETVPRRGYRFIGSVATPSPTRTEATPRPRLLVLPFTNVGGDPAREYYSDAMTDEIITALASLAPQHLALIARTTSMHYKNSRKDVAHIGRMWKWTPAGVAKARQHFEAALACDPRFALACDGLANLYGYLGLWGFLPPDEAEPLRWFYGMRAAELDPTLAEPRTHVAYHPQKTRHEDAYIYNWVEAESGMAADMSGEFPLLLGWLGLARGLGGRAEEARTLLERLRAVAKERFVLPTSFAWLHLGLGEIDSAFAWMTQAANHNDEWIHPLKTYPFLDPVRSDPRFRMLLQKLSLEP